MGEVAVAGPIETTIEIGAMPILVRTESAEFLQILQKRYAGFINPHAAPVFGFDVDIVESTENSNGTNLSVRRVDGRWVIERGDLRAEWEAGANRGRIRQTANPYSIDAAFRIVHTLLLATKGSLLVHAASSIRNGKAYLFAGVSGAGKTTISRLAPPDVTHLTDEISYVRKSGEGYVAFGTPFAGELAEPGENVSAPLAAVYLLQQGPENRIEPVADAEAVRSILLNILFFAVDEEMVRLVFQAACDLVARVPVQRLTFAPDRHVWDLIG